MAGCLRLGALFRAPSSSPTATTRRSCTWLPALVFDNSLRMDYRHANETRLQRAKELALWLLEQLPAESPVTTAIETSKDTLVKMRAMDLSMWVWCPHCMAGHQIKPADAVLEDEIKTTISPALTG